MVVLVFSNKGKSWDYYFVSILSLFNNYSPKETKTKSRGLFNNIN